MNTLKDDLKAWIGRQEKRRDTINPTPLAALPETMLRPSRAWVSAAKTRGTWSMKT